LLPEGEGWNIDKLNEVLFEGDVDDILKIPVGRAGTDDYLAWNYTKNGLFSVRSAYHLKRHLKRMSAGTASSSLNCSEHQGWLSLWGANVPGKVKIHCWRLAQNGLAVGAELNRRHIKEGVRCVACNREETNLHRFWFFPHSVETWDYLRQHAMRELRPPPADIRSPRELQNWLLEWMGSVDETEVQLGMMALYHLWLVRNDARDEALIEDPRRTARRILALSEEWRDVQNEAAVSNPRVEEHWHPPPLGWHKVNADGAFSRDDKHGGGGVIIRDHHGAPLAGASHFFPM
jgi:hypothetical protein